MTSPWEGQRVVVLGGTSGLGLAVAASAARQGAVAIVASRRQANVDAALSQLPHGTQGYVADPRDEAALERFFAMVGPFDHLVYTAGEALALGQIDRLSIEAGRRFFETRYWGALAAAKHGAPLIRPGGSIVFTSGTAGARPHAGWALGASVCAAMEGLTRALAVELAPIRVNIVSPGFIRTPLWRDMAQADREAMYASTGARLPVGRVGEADDVAEAYLFLMRQGFATGQTIVVDGGGVLV